MIAARGTFSNTENEKQRERMAAKRAASNDLIIPDVADPERRRQLAEDDAAWLRNYLPNVFYNPFTDDQLRIIKDCGEVLKYGTKRCKAAPRGDGKSSIVKYLMLKYALERRVRFPLVIAATATKAGMITDSIKQKLAARTETLLTLDYPLECHVARRVHPWPSRARNVTANGGRQIAVEWGSQQGYFILPSWADEEPVGPIFMSLGWTSDSLQGCNVYDMRPDVVMLDDLDSRDSLASDDGAIAPKIEQAIEKTVAGLVGQSRSLGQYFLCTITSEAAAAYKYSDPKLKPSWGGSRVAAVKSWPERMDLWDEYVRLRQKGMQEGDPFAREAHEFYLRQRELMDAKSIVSNPYHFEATELADGSQKEVSNIQHCFNFIADTSREAFDTEYQNDPPKKDQLFANPVSAYHVAECAEDFARSMVDETTTMVVRAVDVRKTELHHVTIGVDSTFNHVIADYNLRTHGNSETSVQQAEELILRALHEMADEWNAEPITDQNGVCHSTDLCLIDKGWVGNWTEDGVVKTWVTQPVETFCMERGLRHFLPAKGQPGYRTPDPSDRCIIGDNWHMNRGKEDDVGGRSCTEVIWNAEHWHMLVEELFMLPADHPDRFRLFAPTTDIWANHKALGEHVAVGAGELKKQLVKGSRSRKPRFVRDHWWDALAMALVAKSIEYWFRENLKPSPKRRTRPVVFQDSTPTNEVGAR